MNSIRMRPLFGIVLVILLVTLACGTGTTTATEAPVLSDQVATEAPVEPTSEAVSVPDSPYYLDEFDGGLENWSEIYFTSENDT
ncbi:MAG: hypothetical protein WBV22_02180, partial [Anaerolineaceae bacterium]